MNEKIVGKLSVLQTFNLTGSVKQRGGVESIAGGKVTEGKVCLERDAGGRNTMFRIVRKNKVVASSIAGMTLRKFKDKVAEVGKGDECGLSLTNYTDFKENDVVECYVVEEKFAVL